MLDFSTDFLFMAKVFFKPYLVAVRTSTNISPQSRNNERHLSLNDIDAISGRHMPLIFDFKHEAMVDGKTITLGKCYKTQNPSLIFFNIANRSRNKEI